MIYRSAVTALVVAAAVQSFTVGVLSKKISIEVCRPGVVEARSLAFDSANQLLLKNSDGAVKVTVGSRPQITVQAEIRAYVPSSDAQPAAEAYVKTLIASTQIGERVEITTEPEKRPDELDLRVDYLIEVPEGTNLTIQGSNGNIWVAKGCGEVDVQGNNSDIEVSDASGEVYAKTANGRIRVNGAAKATTVETVNGSIFATVVGGELKATTANGNIMTTLAGQEVASCDLTAMNGGITLLLSGEPSAEVNATTGRGVVNTDLAVSAAPGASKRRELRGRIGDGDTRVNLNSLNGNISIARSSAS